MSTEIAGRASFARSYARCWEDADVLPRAADVKLATASRASAGDNAAAVDETPERLCGRVESGSTRLSRIANRGLSTLDHTQL